MENLPVITEGLNPVALFVEGGIDEILSKVESEVLSVVPNTETAAGRKDIASLAHMVAKSKVALDNMGKEFVAGKKAELKKVDAQRKKSRDFLDELKANVRQPLTDFEDAEKSRLQAIAHAREMEIAHEEALTWDDLFTREAAIKLEEAKIAKQESERIENERIEKIKKAAEENAKNEAKREAEQKENARIAEIARKQEAEEARQADVAHRERFHSEANRFIRGILGTTEEQATAIIDAISCGAVPHISIKY